MGRRNFEPEYKLRVARMVVDEGQGGPQVSRHTGVGETAIRRWVERLNADRSGGAGDGQPRRWNNAGFGSWKKRTADCGRTRTC